MGWFDKLRAGLSKTREILTTDVRDLGAVIKSQEINWDDLEIALIAADVGAKLSAKIVAQAKENRELGKTFIEGLEQALLSELSYNEQNLQQETSSLDLPPSFVDVKGKVVMVVGVNGVGKTTTIAKLGQYYQKHNKKVMFAAGDTFRAAAATQLEIWGERLKIPTISGPDGGDPGAVAFDATQSRKAKNYDLLFVDTAGRLHTKHNLMEELKKVKRVIGKADEGEPREIWLVIDAVTGQNGLEQARKFHSAVGVTGAIVTKLDGTAKGGIILPIVCELGLPIKFIGVGESPEDLQPYNAKAYVRALLDLPYEEDS